ncbi:30S ribosomal protein S27ae [Candidatus Micrarchaeota archaeon]|nr:30S ribosomal protein S27ae [Candidatus Micrarchaeota archaeon]MBU1930156.1 30S ribosomal protein S27ae [Candidatus Micrarchaeota archaeon]
MSDGKLERKSASCPKCGAGIFMAKHKDRQTCGACGFTQWKKKEVTEKTE